MTGEKPAAAGKAAPLYRRLKEAPRLADPRKARARVNEFLGSDAALELRPLAAEPRVKPSAGSACRSLAFPLAARQQRS